MGKSNNKGFTLVELVATVVILGLVISIGAFSVTSLIKKSREKNYELLIKNINDAAELFYQECKYSGTGVIQCDHYYNNVDKTYDIKLNDLVTYGFLKGNSSAKDNKGNLNDLGLVEPINNQNISNCPIKISYKNGDVEVEAVLSGDENCPSEY